ncbi:MAG: hypothetical protein QOG87_545 [Actinomycetota bacterium]|jgi:hypothetical protein
MARTVKLRREVSRVSLDVELVHDQWVSDKDRDEVGRVVQWIVREALTGSEHIVAVLGITYNAAPVVTLAE